MYSHVAGVRLPCRHQYPKNATLLVVGEPCTLNPEPWRFGPVLSSTCFNLCLRDRVLEFSGLGIIGIL